VGHGLKTNGHPVSRLPTVEGLPLHARALVVLTCYGVADPPPRACEDLVAGAVDRLEGGEPRGSRDTTVATTRGLAGREGVLLLVTAV
jgi:hypothetical protein